MLHGKMAHSPETISEDTLKHAWKKCNPSPLLSKRNPLQHAPHRSKKFLPFPNFQPAPPLPEHILHH